MRKMLATAATVAALSVVSISSVFALTPEGERCVTKNGATLADWRAYRVQDPQASRIRACHAALRAARAK